MRAHLSIGRHRAWRCSLTTALAASALLSWTDPAAAASQTKAPAAQSKAPVAPVSRAPIEATAPDPSPTAEVTFATPQRFAIVSEPRASTRRLYTNGDFLPDPNAAGQGFIMDKLHPDGLQIRDTRGPKSFRVEVGGVIPGSGGRRLEGTVLLDGVEYRYVTAGSTVDPEPRLLQIRERRGHLEVDITSPQIVAVAVPSAPPIPPPATDRSLQLERRLDKAILDKVRVKPAGPDTYEINAADAQMAFDHGGRILAEAMSTIRPMLSLDQGMNFSVKSAGRRRGPGSTRFSRGQPQYGRTGRDRGRRCRAGDKRPADQRLPGLVPAVSAGQARPEHIGRRTPPAAAGAAPDQDVPYPVGESSPPIRAALTTSESPIRFASATGCGTDAPPWRDLANSDEAHHSPWAWCASGTRSATT